MVLTSTLSHILNELSLVSTMNISLNISSKRCNKLVFFTSHFQVYDGLTDSDTLLSTLCGSELPNDVVSSGTDLFIRFTTNAANTDSGFLATFESQMLGNIGFKLTKRLSFFISC